MLNLWGWWEFSKGLCPSPLYIYGTSPESPTPSTHHKVRASLVGNFKHQFSVLNNITYIFTLFFTTHISKNTIFKLFYQTGPKSSQLALFTCHFASLWLSLPFFSHWTRFFFSYWARFYFCCFCSIFHFSNAHSQSLGRVWMACLECFSSATAFFCGSHVLVSTDFNKINFKTGFRSIIHIFIRNFFK